MDCVFALTTQASLSGLEEKIVTHSHNLCSGLCACRLENGHRIQYWHPTFGLNRKHHAWALKSLGRILSHGKRRKRQDDCRPTYVTCERKEFAYERRRAGESHGQGTRAHRRNLGT